MAKKITALIKLALPAGKASFINAVIFLAMKI